MVYRIGISGSYGGMNLGDEAILEGMLKALRATLDVEVSVVSSNVKDTENRHKVRALSLHDMQKEEVCAELKKLDLFVLGGGGLLFDGVVEMYLREVIWAKELGIPVMIYAISVGPLKNPSSKELVVKVLNTVDIITVRENESKKILKDLGVVKPIEVTADPSLLLEPADFTKEMLDHEMINGISKLVGVSIREPGLAAPELNADFYHEVIANAADFMIDRFNAQILFVPMEAVYDSKHAHAIIAKMASPHKACVLRETYTSSQILGLMKHFDLALGMRLHFLIFAALQEVPSVPLQYASKVRGFLQDVDMILIEEWAPGKVCAVIDTVWNTREGIKKKLREKVPPLKEKAGKTNQMLCELLRLCKPKG